MKLMKKILVSAIAISAIAAFNAVAFAEEEVTPVVPAATYDATAKTITLSGFEVANDQKTLLILNADVDQFDDTTAKAEAEGGAIVQIDQSTAMNGVAIPVGERTPGSKVWIRVGGDDTGFIELEYTIPGGGDNRFTNPDNLLGDVSGDGVIIMNDVSLTLSEYVEPGALEGDQLEAADASDDGSVIMNDVSLILSAYVDLESSDIYGKKLSDKTVLVRDVRAAASTDAE